MNDIQSNDSSYIAHLMSTPFKTGGILVNFSQNSVVYKGDVLVLQPKVVELLVLLCAARGNTLSKDELVAALWPEVIVGPDSLANTMARLRKALNDSVKHPMFIQTVQRKGYRWLLDVEVNEQVQAFDVDYSVNQKVSQNATIVQSAMRPILHRLNKQTKIVIFSITGLISLVVIGYFSFRHQPEPFLFPDLYIEKLDGGGYEIQAGIEGELTEEKKAAMLKELKRITGEEFSGMEFTVDPKLPECDKTKINSEHSVTCDKTPKVQQ